MAPLVSISGLKVAFDGTLLLHGIDLDISKGEAVGDTLVIRIQREPSDAGQAG